MTFRRLTITVKPRCWCWWYYLNEAGLAACQIGCIVAEWNTATRAQHTGD